jgi:NADPH:quinone reductase-like Zn-dependent oxidoreductase
MARRINNALVIKMINGKGTLEERTVQFPEPRSNQALIRVSHVAQNSVDGTVCRRMLVLAM